MFLFYVLSFFKKGDSIQGWGHYLRKYGKYSGYSKNYENQVYWKIISNKNIFCLSNLLNYLQILNKQYMTNPTIVYPVKMEYRLNFSISGLKIDGEKWSRKNISSIFDFYWLSDGWMAHILHKGYSINTKTFNTCFTL